MIIIELFKLFGSILVDNAEANKSISKTDKNAEGLGSKLMSGIKTAGMWGAAIGAGAAAAGGAMLAMANKTAEAADFIDKLSERTGINREELQRWKYAAEQSGADIGKLEVGMKKLSETMDKASTGSKLGAEAFDRLGISMEEVESKSPSEMFELVAKKLADMPDSAERNALGNQLLGKSYTELMPLLNAGSEGMQQLKDRADELGIVMSEDAVKANVVFGDTLADVKSSFGAVFMHLSDEFLPALQSFLDFILANMPEIQKVVVVAFDYIGKVMKFVIGVVNDYLMPALKYFVDLVRENMPEIQSFFEVTFKYIGEIITAFVELALAFWDKFGGYIMSQTKVIFDTTKTVIEAAFKVIKGILDVFIGLFTGDWERMGEGLTQIWQGLWKGIEAIVRGAWGLISNAFNSLRSAIQNWFANLASSAYQWGRNMISGFVDGIKSMASAVSSAVSGVVGNAKSFIGFNSPTEKGEGRHIVEWGENMIQGFLDGVKKATPQVEATLGAIIPGIDTRQASASQVSTSPSIINEFNIQSMTVRDEQDIKKIARELFILQKSAGRGLGIIV